MAAKTAGDGSKAYTQSEGTRPFKGIMSLDPNMPAVPVFVSSSDKKIDAMPVPVTGDHPKLG